MDKISVDFLTEMALHINEQDPISFDKLSIEKQDAFKLVATSILEMFDKEEYTYDDKVVLLSTITKLTVENMLLHIKLLSGQESVDNSTENT